jgi:hypothetical protein
MAARADGTPQGMAKALMDALPTLLSVEITEGPARITYRCTPVLDPPQKAMATHVVSTLRPQGTAVDVY